MLKINDIINDKYIIVSRIGNGGTSKVYLARDRNVENLHWAVKEIDKTNKLYLAKVQDEGRFTEADIMTSVKNPFAPRIVDKIETEESLILIMDLVEGTDLGSKLSEEGPQPEKLVVEWMLGICSLMETLHGLPDPVIYTDMKPDNIILKKNGAVCVIYFGSARYLSNQVKKARLGTIGYCSPEHKHGIPDERSDIYTLGMTMYELLTCDDTIMEKSFRRREVDSPKLEAIIKKCTYENPAERYQTVAELRRTLEEYKLIELYSGDRNKAMTSSLIQTELVKWEENLPPAKETENAFSDKVSSEEEKKAAAKRKKQKKNATAAGILVKALGTSIRTIAAILVTILAAIGVVTLIYPELRDTFFLIVKQTLMVAGIGSGG